MKRSLSAVKCVLAPVHVFGDLSLINRLAPLLAALTPSAVPSPPSPTVELAAPTAPSPSAIDVRCSMLRVDLRCPDVVSPSRPRTGIITLDVHALKVSRTTQRRVVTEPRDPIATSDIEITLGHAWLFHLPAGGTVARAFVAVGPSAHDSGGSERSRAGARITIGQRSGGVSRIVCGVQEVQADMDKIIFDGLQYFANDLSLAFAAPIPTPVSVIDGRYFRPTREGSASDSSSSADSAASRSPMQITVSVEHGARNTAGGGLTFAASANLQLSKDVALVADADRVHVDLALNIADEVRQSSSDLADCCGRCSEWIFRSAMRPRDCPRPSSADLVSCSRGRSSRPRCVRRLSSGTDICSPYCRSSLRPVARPATT